MPITELPTPPERSDPSNFASRGDAFMTALPTFATEANALATDVNADAATASAAASTATTQAGNASTSASNASASASTATTQAGIATTQAGIATTQASNALASANAAAASAAVINLTAPGPIGGTTPSTGAFTTGSFTGAVTLADGFDVRWGDASTFIAGNSTSDVIQFAAAGSERARVNSAGISVTGAVSATATGAWLANTGPSTSNKYTSVANNAGLMYYGIESSAGGTIISGTGAYSGVVAAASGLHLSGNGTASQATLDSAGQFGVGKTPDAWNSDFKAVQVGINTSIYGRVASTSYSGMSTNAYRNAGGNWIYQSTAAASRYDQDTGVHAWFNAPSGTAGNTITFTQALTLDALGNLLVGMTSATASSAKTIHMANSTVPTANPTGGGVLYVESGALKYRGSSGTITTLAAA